MLEEAGAQEVSGSTGEPDSTFWSSSFNGMALLIGLSVLSAPYAFQKAGYFSCILNPLVPMSYWYGAELMARCLNRHKTLRNYQDIAKTAFNKWGEGFTNTLFYLELLGNLVSNLISIADTLVYIFPAPNIGFSGVRGRYFLVAIATLGIAPTLWFKKLSSISYLSLLGIICILINIVCLFYLGIQQVGFHYNIPGFRYEGVPEAIGVFAFSYAGIPIFPSFYKSMTRPQQFSKVLILSFMVAIGCHFVIGITGMLMFGGSTKEQIHLNLPQHSIASKITAWTTVALPMTKFMLVLTPISTELENLMLQWLPCDKTSKLSIAFCLLLRLSLLVMIVLISLFIPFFSSVIELIGCSVSIMLCMIFPYIFYLRLFPDQANAQAKLVRAVIYILIVIGTASAFLGTIFSFHKLIEKKKQQMSN